MKLHLAVVNELSNIQRLSISGHIEAAYIEPLGNEFEKLCAGPAVKLILDMQGAEGISGSGIGELIRVRNDIVGKGGKIVLMGANTRVEKIIDISGLDKYFPVALCVSDAIEMLNEKPGSAEPI